MSNSLDRDDLIKLLAEIRDILLGDDKEEPINDFWISAVVGDPQEIVGLAKDRMKQIGGMAERSDSPGNRSGNQTVSVGSSPTPTDTLSEALKTPVDDPGLGAEMDKLPCRI